MVVSERAASADARGSGREGDMGDATLSTRRACGVHCCACAHGRTLRSGRRQSPRGRDTAEQPTAQLSLETRGGRRESAYSYICERKMKVLCICSFLCFVCLIMSPTPRAFGLHASHAATSNLHASKKWRGRNAQIWFASCSARRRSRTMAQPSVEAAVPHVDLVVES